LGQAKKIGLRLAGGLLVNKWLRLRSAAVISLHDIVMVTFAWIGAYWLRFNLSQVPEPYWTSSIRLLPFVIVIQAVIFRWLGLYRGVWRFASIPDLIRIGKAVALGVVVVSLAAFLYNRLVGVPRSIFPLYSILLLLLLCGPRVFYRMHKDRGVNTGNRKTALVIGAGSAGELLVRDLLRERDAQYHPIAFVDDDPRKKGREIHGVRVRGSCDTIPKLAKSLGVETLLIAMPSATEKQMRRVVELCERVGVPFLTLPSVLEALSGYLPGKLRDVSIEDLLGRDPVKLDRQSISNHLQGKRVLVTGGGGSIGSQLCVQIAQFPIQQLIVYERCEYNLYKIDGELKRCYPNLMVEPLLGDVTDRDSIERVLERYQPDVIFHAAAYKHVPLLETQVRAAVENNVRGTLNVAEAAKSAGVKEFVLISTDKAVNPTNVMGATKRIAEMIVQSLQSPDTTRFVTVRFGNVLDSAGSVVPLFREQIRRGGPVTVTHPDITRYFMTIPEACQLIMQAATTGEGGEVFVLDMGEPVKVAYLAEQMIRLSGKRPGVDIQIEYIGLRPGEKMHEELFYGQERLERTPHNKLRLAQSREIGMGFAGDMEKLFKASIRYDSVSIESALKDIVPEFAGDNYQA
jgi:FlaA1/EpsC-like NDP-sugar epimerase